jgi:hypothetical protein
MKTKTLTILNTSILTSYGKFSYEPLSREQARQLVREYQSNGWVVQSAIGHQSTADLLTMLLDYPVAVNRIEFKQTPEDVALVFRPKQRIGEGKVLTREELEGIGYEFGLLVRTA